MENKDAARVMGIMELILKDQNGAIKERRVEKNLIVNNGNFGIAAQLLATPAYGVPTHLGIGTGATAPAAGDTALGTETGTRVAFSSKTRATNVVTMVGTFAAGNGTAAITEAGIFNASSSGSMYSRVTFAVINKGAADSLQLTWTYTIG